MTMERRTTLPASYYTDPDLYAREQDRFFSTMWVCAAREEDVAAPGDYVLRDIAGESCILTRDTAGRLHAFRETEAESKLFRTAAVAFRYAEMSAAIDRYASARMAGEDAASELGDLEAQQTLYRELSRRLMDDGMAAMVLDAWERADEARDRRRFH